MKRKKLFFRKYQLSNIDVPALPELSIEKMYPQACKIRDFRKYMPNTWTTCRKIERDYFWKICSTLKPAWVQSLIADCRRQRQERKDKKQKQPTLMTICRDFAIEMLAQPYDSSRYYSSCCKLLFLDSQN